MALYLLITIDEKKFMTLRVIRIRPIPQNIKLEQVHSLVSGSKLRQTSNDSKKITSLTVLCYDCPWLSCLPRYSKLELNFIKNFVTRPPFCQSWRYTISAKNLDIEHVNLFPSIPYTSFPLTKWSNDYCCG